MWTLIVTAILIFILFTQRKFKTLPLRPTVQFISFLKSPYVEDIESSKQFEKNVQLEKGIKFLFIYDSYCDLSLKAMNDFVFAASQRADKAIFFRGDIQKCPFLTNEINAVPSILKISEKRVNFHGKFQVEEIIQFIDVK
jgi:hypothetical protein